MLVRLLLGFGEAFPKSDQVALGSRCTGVSWSKDAAEAPRRVLEEFLGKYQFVSRGSSAMCDRPRVTVGQPEVYIVAEHSRGESYDHALVEAELRDHAL